VLIRIMIFLTSTTPAAATASAFPSSAEEGSCDSRVGQQPLTPWATNLTPLRGYFAKGSGLNCSFTTLLVVPLPVSVWNGARVA